MSLLGVSNREGRIKHSGINRYTVFGEACAHKCRLVGAVVGRTQKSKLRELSVDSSCSLSDCLQHVQKKKKYSLHHVQYRTGVVLALTERSECFGSQPASLYSSFGTSHGHSFTTIFLLRHNRLVASAICIENECRAPREVSTQETSDLKLFHSLLAMPATLVRSDSMLAVKVL